jgi:hypothetical protein
MDGYIAQTAGPCTCAGMVVNYRLVKSIEIKKFLCLISFLTADLYFQYMDIRVIEICRNMRECVGFEVLSSSDYEDAFFWDIMTCSLLNISQHFRGTCHLHLQG